MYDSRNTSKERFQFSKKSIRSHPSSPCLAAGKVDEPLVCFRKHGSLGFGARSESSGCLSCGDKSPVTTSLDEPLKGPGVQTRTTTKPKIHEDFWTGSARDMDNSAVLSQGSISSISTSNQTLDPRAGSATSSSEFVNHGLLLWNQTRQHWTNNKKPENRLEQIREPKLSWNATYESLLGSNKPFRQPIPLAEMVDFLVDIWEQEGMYD